MKFIAYKEKLNCLDDQNLILLNGELVYIIDEETDKRSFVIGDGKTCFKELTRVNLEPNTSIDLCLHNDRFRAKIVSDTTHEKEKEKETVTENYIVINGKKAELTAEQLKALGITPEKRKPF